MHLLTAPVFGSKHLIGLLYVAIIVVITLISIKKFDKKTYLIIAFIFILLEILKIGYMIDRDGSYPINHLPFHLCSMPLYIYIIVYFSKAKSKLETWAKPAAYVTVLAAGITALVMPVNIIGELTTWNLVEENYLPFISFTYHGFMISVPLTMVLKGEYLPKIKDIPYALLFTFVLMVIALILNAILDTDFMLLNRGNGSPFQSYLEHGQFVYITLIILLGVVMISLIMSITVGIKKLVRKV